MHIIGISGESGSGKSTVANLLASLIKDAKLLSISSLIKADIERLNLASGKVAEHYIGRHRRVAKGADYWITRAIHEQGGDCQHLIISSVFSSDEFEAIKREGGVVVWIDAPLAVRRSRLEAEGRTDVFEPQTLATEGKRERDPEAGSSLRAAVRASLHEVRDAADFLVDNSGSIDDLKVGLSELAPKFAKLFSAQSENLSRLRRDASRHTPTSDTEDAERRLQRRLTRAALFTDKLIEAVDRRRLDEEQTVSSPFALSTYYDDLFSPDLLSVTAAETKKKIALALEPENPSEALELFRKLSASTPDEVFLFAIPDSEFFDIHAAAHLEWMTERDGFEKEIQERLKEIRRYDRMQFVPANNRSVTQLRSEGVSFCVDSDKADEVAAKCPESIRDAQSVVELTKNDRVFEVSGFKDAKVSLVIHDIIDHMWTFDLCDRLGLFEKYSTMFSEIGDPASSDIYKREGEAVAAVSYAVRAFDAMSPGFQSIVGIKSILRKVRDWRGDLNDTHTEALRIVNNIDSDSLEWRSLGFAFSNYLAELDVQRLKFGAIKRRKSTNQRIYSELDPFSPDYLCFFIELHNALIDPGNGHKQALFSMHYLLEDYLRCFLEDENPPPTLTVLPSDLSGQNLAVSPNVPRNVAEWMRTNSYFSVVRSRV